jgi:hypothetical protein
MGMPKGQHAVPKSKRTYKYPDELAKRAAKVARRQEVRLKQGKKPLAVPLEIIPEKTGKGCLAFKSQIGEISVQLQNSLGCLQGIYQMNGNHIVTVRSSGATGEFSLKVYDFSPQRMAETGRTERGWFNVEEGGASRRVSLSSDRPEEIGWFDAEGDLAHHHVDLSVKRRGLGQKIQSKIDRHTRSMPEAEGKKTWIGAYGFRTDSRLIGFFKRLDYKITPLGDGKFSVSKSGKTRKTNDMRRFHTIEAVDPKTGRAREYVFPVSGK